MHDAKSCPVSVQRVAAYRRHPELLRFARRKKRGCSEIARIFCHPMAVCIEDTRICMMVMSSDVVDGAKAVSKVVHGRIRR